MQAFRRRLPSIGLVLVLAACAVQTPTPEWISGVPPGYPAERWIVGVGSGASGDAAADAARAKIAAQTTEDTSGARIAATWLDEGTGTHWALATLDREPLRARLASDLAAVDQQQRALLARADEATPDQALALLSEALRLDDRRTALADRLTRFAGASAAGAAGAPDRAQLEQRLAEAKRSLPIEVEAWEMDPKTGETLEPLDEMRRALTQKVIALGFPVSDGNVRWGDDSTWLLVRSRLGLERLELLPSDRMVAVHWDAAVEVVDRTANGRLVAVLTDEGRATHLNEREARREAQETAEHFASHALGEWLSARVASATPTATP